MSPLHQLPPDRRKDRLRHDRRYTVPDHPKRVPHCRMKPMSVGKALQPRRLPYRNHTRSLRMNRSKCLMGPAIRACTRPKDRALAFPSQAGVSSHPVHATFRYAFEPLSHSFRVSRCSMPGEPMVRRPERPGVRAGPPRPTMRHVSKPSSSPTGTARSRSLIAWRTVAGAHFSKSISSSQTGSPQSFRTPITNNLARFVAAPKSAAFHVVGPKTPYAPAMRRSASSSTPRAPDTAAPARSPSQKKVVGPRQPRGKTPATTTVEDRTGLVCLCR